MNTLAPPPSYAAKNSTVVPFPPARSLPLNSHARRSRPSRGVRAAEVAGWLAQRTGMRTTSWVAPGLVSLWAERLFLTPPKPRYADEEMLGFLDARQDFVSFQGRMLATWRWGGHDAPAVLLAHGWGGSAAQMLPLVQSLLNAGYRVIAFDQPAHGLSEGRITGLPEFAGAIAAVANYHGNVVAAVGHSLGGSALAFAISRGLGVERAVLINAPSDMTGFSRRFARFLSLPERVRARMQRAIEERFGVRWSEFEMAALRPRLSALALVIHDRDDREVPLPQGELIAEAWPDARLLRTHGLGHARILKDSDVGRAVADFIGGGTGHASPASQLLSAPAPLY